MKALKLFLHVQVIFFIMLFSLESLNAKSHRKLPVQGDVSKVREESNKEEKKSIKFESSNKSLALELSTADVISLPSSVSEIFLSNPDIADLQQSNPGVAYIYAKRIGKTSLIATDAEGKMLLSMDVHVTHNLKELRQVIANVYNASNVQVHSVPGGLLLKGAVPSAQLVTNIMNLANRFITAGDQVINHMQVTSSSQVMLKVRFASVQRTALKKLGINWNSMKTNYKLGTTTTAGFLNGRNISDSVSSWANVPNPVLGIARATTGSSIIAVLDALAKENLATVLAEPTLVATSGETANFLSGGEFPVPVPQSSGASPNITINFKSYGVGLACTPTVLNEDLISLRVRPEVSDTDNTNAVELQGMSIPAISISRADTTVQLASGQSFAIAGLLRSKITNNSTGVAGLQDIPGLGALFRSTEYERNETELVIIVTPYIVEPTSPQKLKDPFEGSQFKGALETLLTAKMNYVNEPEGRPRPITESEPLAGSAGFSLE